MELKTVQLQEKHWNKILDDLVVGYESTRDWYNTTGNEEEMEELRNDLEDMRIIMENIQEQTGISKYKMLVVGMNDVEVEVKVRFEDPGMGIVEVDGVDGWFSKEELEDDLQKYSERLENEGVPYYFGLVTLVLYKEDIEYLLKNIK